jgi:predicted SAM-dependent methyltransferase
VAKILNRGGDRVHIGCGDNAMPGWINIDSKARPGVLALDIRSGLPFENVNLIFAEHFLEHLGLADAMKFLRECRRVLSPEGILRLSTPNLDWVLASHYRQDLWGDPNAPLNDCLRLNRAFHGWGHQFLYNRQMLHASLKDAGFESIADRRYGQSDIPDLANIEKHETWIDTPDLPHVLVVEAAGIAEPSPIPPAMLAEFFQGIDSR